MYELAKAHILDYIRNGAETYQNILEHAGEELSLENPPMVILGALLDLVNAGTVTPIVSFCIVPNVFAINGTALERDIVAAMLTHGRHATIAQIADMVPPYGHLEVMQAVHALLWRGVLSRDYRYAMASSSQAAPQESVQSDDTTPPPPAA